jgi:hypothetical protein
MGVEKLEPAEVLGLFVFIVVPLLVRLDGVSMYHVYSEIKSKKDSKIESDKANSKPNSNESFVFWNNLGYYAAMSLYVSAFAIYYKKNFEENLNNEQISDFYVTFIFYALVYLFVATMPMIMLHGFKKTHYASWRAAMYFINFVGLTAFNICLTSLYYMFDEKWAGTLQLGFTLVMFLPFLMYYKHLAWFTK